MMEIVEKIVTGLVAFILAGALVPIAIYSTRSVNTSQVVTAATGNVTLFSSAEAVVFGTFGILFLVGLLLGVVYMYIKHKQ